VTTYTNTNGWTQSQVIIGDQLEGFFGTSLDLFRGGMIVGAPGVFENGTVAPIGAAYYYEYRSASSQWAQFGSTMRSRGDVQDFNQEFGASVGTAGAIPRVVIGAPGRDNGNGGVYTFDYKAVSSTSNTLDWVNMRNLPLNLSDPQKGRFGSAVAISNQGTRILTSAPGWGSGKGLVKLYEYDTTTSDWVSVFSVPGLVANETFGTSLTFLSASGDAFAVGGTGGDGVIRVYAESNTTSHRVLRSSKRNLKTITFQQVGSDLQGAPNEKIGTLGSFSGTSQAGKVSILVGASDGIINRFDLEGGVWARLYAPIDTGFKSPVTGVAVANGSSTFVAGVATANSASFYATAFSPPTQSPTTTRNPSGTAKPSSVRPLGPTLAPSKLGTLPPGSTYSPASSPSTTLAPSVSNITWKQTAAFTGDGSIGSSVAIASNQMVAGDRTTASGFKTYVRSSNATWTVAQSLVAPQSNARFGSSTSLNSAGTALVIGAPTATINSHATGAVYYYTLQSTTGSSWLQVGSALVDATSTVGESFGASVSLSDTNVLVVGAPYYKSGSSSINAGRIVVYKFIPATKAFALQLNVSGAASSTLGAAVAISADGSTIVAGAPLGNSARIYSWNCSKWRLTSTLSGLTTSETLGTSVAMLSSDGKYLAVGGAGYANGAGIVRVYERSSTSSYVPLGNPIVGAAGDLLGSEQSITGSTDAASGLPSLLAATATGHVRTFELQGTSVWTEPVASVATGLLGVPVVSGSLQQKKFAAGSRNKLVIYEL
jgi:hypothetical protein